MLQTTGERLSDLIQNDILTGMLKPGERLDEVSLAKRYDVSRTPIREALRHLNALGMVEIRPRRGAIVAKAAPERVIQMFEVMAELESMAGRLAARRHTEDDREALVKAHAACRAAAQTGDTDSYYYENEVFHFAIYAASHNAFLAEQCHQLHRQIAPYRRLQLRARNRLSTSLAEHDDILKAILEGDSAMSSESLRSHIAIQGERFGDFIASLEQS
jgi:DNA-binding GntR family transcriptional regulator